jgi:hypothetical protein
VETLSPGIINGKTGKLRRKIYQGIAAFFRNFLIFDEFFNYATPFFRYLEVAKKVYDNPVLYDFLLLLAEAPYPCFWTISPIIRALLSTSLMYFESTPLKEGKPNRTEIEKLDALFTLFIKV